MTEATYRPATMNEELGYLAGLLIGTLAITRGERQIKALVQAREAVERAVAHTRRIEDVLDTCLELFEDMLGPDCDPGCECILHDLRALLGREAPL